jgi:DNA-binding NtrC family response regulator
VFDEAHEGTILLDDVDRLPPAVQGQLLRYLESRLFRRVGGITDIRVDVRIMATSTQAIEPLVSAGTFPSDLFYRLNVLGLEIPPLAAHREDVVVLARHFVEQNRRARRLDIRGLSADAETVLAAYDWPGNIDELRAVIDRAVMIASGQEIEPSHLGLAARAETPPASHPFRLPNEGCVLDEVERSLVLQALDRAGGNQTRAATLLGVHRDQIRYRMGKYRRSAG